MSSVRAVIVLVGGVLALTIYLSFGTAVMPVVQEQVVASSGAQSVPIDGGLESYQDRTTAIMFQWIPVAAFGTVVVSAVVIALRKRRVAR
jgi:hypothetical protein